MYAGIVLAAGPSTRFGSPKALIPIQGEAAVARASRLLKENGCDPVLVVVGAQSDQVQKAIPTFAQVVKNESWSQGRTGSLKAGIRQVPTHSSTLVWPVDHPVISSPTIRKLLGASGLIRVPTYDGRRGHPTLFGSTLRSEILSLKEDQPLHDVVHAKPDRVVEVPVNDPGILLNLDTPKDLEKIKALGISLEDA